MKIINKIFIALAIILILVGGVFVYYKFYRVFSPVPDKMVSEKSEAQYYTVDMTYPDSSVGKYPEIFSFIQKSKQDFLSDAGSITDEDAKVMNLGGDRKYNFTMTTRIATSTKTITYIIENYTFTGGAHGGTTVNTFTYDVNGKYLTLDNVFISLYLDKISAIARAYFYDTIDSGYFQKDSVDSGTAPVEENYSSWYLTDKNIVFIFGQYSVGPYVLGIQEFTLDKKLVANIISPKYK